MHLYERLFAGVVADRPDVNGDEDDDDDDRGAATTTATKPFEASTVLLESATIKIFPDSAASTGTATATWPIEFVPAALAAVSPSDCTAYVFASDSTAAAAVTATTIWPIEPVPAAPVAVFAADSTTVTVAAAVSSSPSFRCNFSVFSSSFSFRPLGAIACSYQMHIITHRRGEKKNEEE